MIDELMDIVNENDEVIGQATRSECYAKKYSHRIVHVLVFDNQGKVALQLSCPSKSFLPGYWGTSAGGHVQSGENNHQAAKRELREELGIESDLELMGKDIYKDERGFTKIVSSFKTTYTGTFILDPAEGSKIEYFSIEEIKKLTKTQTNIYPELLFLLKKYYL
ncbi:MAG: NUDIX domain-containing protein [Candidatus Magasanikbacteria bacterium]|jgi:isopentenyldiphosphate isomerase